jgi:hypothetical protein
MSRSADRGLHDDWACSGVDKALSVALRKVTGRLDKRGLGVDRFVDRRAR